LLASAPLAAHHDIEPDWLGVPMCFGGIGERATRSAVQAAGLLLDRARVVTEDECNGYLVRFLWLTAHNRHPPDARHAARAGSACSAA
jgi:hypothetical protein